MNTCPHCGETLQEGARFCPYCMTSLDEKAVIATPIPKRRRLLAVSAVLLLLIAVLGVLLWPKSTEPPTDTGGSTTTTTTTVQGGAAVPPAGSVPSGGSQPSGGAGSTGSTGETSGSTTTTANGDPLPSVDTPVVTAPQGVTYTYIKATEENAFPLHGSVPATMPDAVVITRVSGAAANGVYDVPATLGGKPVVAIRPAAFVDVCEHVKVVKLPASMRTVWSGAFSGCYDMTDLYIRSGILGMYVDAFPPEYKRTGTLTLHSTYDCHDYGYYYYRNIADEYDAQWAQWNG